MSFAVHGSRARQWFVAGLRRLVEGRLMATRPDEAEGGAR
jgi:hypothetical protein